MSEPQRVRVAYDGPYTAVEVDLPDGGTALCERGKSISVPPEVAKGLCEQPDWTKSGKEKE